MRVRSLLTCAVTVLTVGALGMTPAAAIANGYPAGPGQFPFAVQLRMSDITPAGGAPYDSACSGVLISSSWIMTAGHCFHDGNRNRITQQPPAYQVTATLGTANTGPDSADPGETRTVTWVEQSPDNDIAVARLDAPVDGVQPLTLNTKKPVRGDILSFAGWGATTADGTWSDRLYWGQVTVSTVKPSTVMVVGYLPQPDTSACPYDSGAPYFTDGPVPVLVSIESNGPSCPHSSQETTARVDVIADWANGVTGSSSADQGGSEGGAKGSNPRK